MIRLILVLSLLGCIYASHYEPPMYRMSPLRQSAGRPLILGAALPMRYDLENIGRPDQFFKEKQFDNVGIRRPDDEDTDIRIEGAGRRDRIDDDEEEDRDDDRRRGRRDRDDTEDRDKREDRRRGRRDRDDTDDRDKREERYDDRRGNRDDDRYGDRDDRRRNRGNRYNDFDDDDDEYDDDDDNWDRRRIRWDRKPKNYWKPTWDMNNWSPGSWNNLMNYPYPGAPGQNWQSWNQPKWGGLPPRW